MDSFFISNNIINKNLEMSTQNDSVFFYESIEKKIEISKVDEEISSSPELYASSSASSPSK